MKYWKKFDFCCYLIAKENNAISTGTQGISAARLLCFTMLVMTNVTREPRTQQGRMLMQNKTRGFCQDWGSNRWMNLFYLTFPGRPGSSSECWGISPQEKRSLLCVITFQIKWKHRNMGALNFTLQKTSWNEFFSGAALLEPIEFC